MGVLALTMAATVFVGCKKNNHENHEGNVSTENFNYTAAIRNGGGDIANDDEETMPPFLTTDLPVFPLEALYVVSKEYESAEDGTSDKTEYNGRQITSYSKVEYFESRLIDLYPSTAYVGIVDDSQDFCDSVVAIYNSYLNNEFSDSTFSKNGLMVTGWDEVEIEYISDESEIEIFQMTEEEIAKFKAMNELARMERFATLDDILKVGGKTQDLKAVECSWTSLAMIAAYVTSYVFNRAQLCAARAYQKTYQFYLEDVTGKKCDAFKHTFVNVLLRKSLSRFIAYLIMDVYWETAHPNPCCDKYMDWHNNYVGRVTKYGDFTSTNGWENWAVNVRDFINNGSNNNGSNAYRVYWDESTSCSTIKDQEKVISDYKYIYRK